MVTSFNRIAFDLRTDKEKSKKIDKKYGITSK